MGLLDILKRKSPLEKAAKELREPFAQPEYRRTAMDTLLEIGTDEAYEALLRRFTFNANGQIADESEKRDLVEHLVDAGDRVLGPLKAFIRREKKIAHPIRALVRIVGKEEAIRFLIEALQSYEPLDHRSTEAKTTLVLSLSELAEKKDVDAFLPYLDDHDDDVQFQAIVAIERLAVPETREALCKVCESDEHASRIQRRAAQALMELKWSVKAHFDRFHPELKEQYVLGKKGNLVRKHGGTKTVE